MSDGYTINNETAQLLDRLCAYFDGELERQETVLLICRAQGEAARAMDPDVIEKRTQALSTLIREAADAERERLAVVTSLAERIHTSDQGFSLSQLIQNVPEPWRRRLTEYQRRLREVVSETKDVVSGNVRAMRRSLRMVNNSLELVMGPESGRSYTHSGAAPEGHNREPSVLNAQG